MSIHAAYVPADYHSLEEGVSLTETPWNEAATPKWIADPLIDMVQTLNRLTP